MIYNGNRKTEYRVKFYRNSENNKSPVLEYVNKTGKKERAKILKYIEFLRENKGYLDEPYSRHIKGKIRELRIDFSERRYRIFYFVFVKKNIILLHSFLKKTQKTPKNEIRKADSNYRDVINNPKLYE